jgi:23S rRNA pseudouridine1911/1915/1917 synthase
MPLGKHPTVKHKYAVRWDPSGKESVTLYRVREHYDDFTLVELELKTGRTHQIRVHLSHLGYPIVGDDIYGGRHLTIGDIVGPSGLGDLPARAPLITRQALHAARLGFVHPTTRKDCVFEAPVPEDMHRLITMLRNHRHGVPRRVAGATVDLDRAVP